MVGVLHRQMEVGVVRRQPTVTGEELLFVLTSLLFFSMDYLPLVTALLVTTLGD